MSRSDERGQVTVMIIGFAFVLLLAIAVVVDASAAYLQRSGLDSVADGAALAGTEGVDRSAGYRSGLGSPVLDEALVREAVSAYLRDTDARHRFPGLTWHVAVADGRVSVEVRASLRLPLRVPGSRDRATIASSGSAVLTRSP